MTRHEQGLACSEGADAKRRSFQSHRRLTFPGRRRPVELPSVVLPITAFMIRFFVGVRAIRTNHCGRMDRGVQGIACSHITTKFGSNRPPPNSVHPKAIVERPWQKDWQSNETPRDSGVPYHP
jgi:hypothetical protein